MIVKITSKRQVTFPAHVLNRLGVKPGDHLELTEGPDGYILRPRRIDYTRLGPCGIRSSQVNRSSTFESSAKSPMTRASGLILPSSYAWPQETRMGTSNAAWRS